MRFGIRVSAGRDEVSSSWRTNEARSILSDIVLIASPEPGLIRTMVSRSWNWNTAKSYLLANDISRWEFDAEPFPLRKSASHSWTRPVVAWPGNEIRMELAEQFHPVLVGREMVARSTTYFKKPEMAR
jgi:hypothetical protein